jgi:hypothetical protein
MAGTPRRLLCAAAVVAIGAASAMAEPLPTPVVKVTQQPPPAGAAAGLIQVHLTVSNWQSFPPALFEPAPTLPPCGPGAAASITRTSVEIFDAVNRKRLESFCTLTQPQQMQDIAFATTPAEKPRFVYVTVTDRKLKRRAMSAKVKIP